MTGHVAQKDGLVINYFKLPNLRHVFPHYFIPFGHFKQFDFIFKKLPLVTFNF